MPTVAQDNGTENVILPLVISTTNIVAICACRPAVAAVVLAPMIVKVQKRVKLVQSAAEVRLMKSTGNAKTFQ